MVFAHTVKTHRTSRPHPDANRIAGLAAAITINTGLLMLLLVPMSAPPSLSMPDVINPIHWVQDRPKPPKPPIPVPVTKAQPRASAPVAQPRTVAPTAVAPVILDHGIETAIEPVADPQPGANIGASTAPLSGMRLEYASAPAPAYPRDALREGVEGVVLLQVLVDIDGRPLQVDVQHSSGDRRLDIAARRQVLQHWTFRPAMQDGRAIQAIGVVPIAFHLHD